MNIEQKIGALYEALSASEKRYVSLWFEKEPTNGPEMLKRLKKITDSSAPAKTKTADKKLFHLYQVILRALRAYHEGTSINMELYALQMNVEFLYNKRLYEQALYELERLIKLAERYNRHTILVQALELELNILIERYPQNMAADFEKQNNRIGITLGNLQHSYTLSRNRQALFVMLRTTFSNRNPENKTRTDTLLIEAEQSAVHLDEFTANRNLFTIRALHALYSGDWLKAHRHYREMLQLWDNNPGWIAADQLTYKKQVSNYLNTCHANRQFDEIPELLRRIRSIPCRTAEEEAEQFQNVYFIELLHLLNTDRFADLPELTAAIEDGLKKYKSKINAARELMFYYNLSIASFMLENWKDALQWLDRMLEVGKNEHRRDIQATARLLRLVYYYELGKHDLLEYELINTERYLRQQKIWTNYESAIVKLFKKLLDAGPADKKDLLHQFEQQVPEWQQTGQVLPAVSELQLWARAGTGNQRIRVVARG